MIEQYLVNKEEDSLPYEVKDIVARRTDLGTFLVHLTRGDATEQARENLRQILTEGQLEARNPFGPAVAKLRTANMPVDSQRCVCFTETPLEHTHMLIAEITGRAIQFAPYGIAFPKKLGRAIGINPVWYLDITPGHDWLTQPFDALIDSAIASGNFDESPIKAIAPFIEQMGTRRGGGGYRKEFWWEREWRIRGDCPLPDRVIVLCPEQEFHDFSQVVEESGVEAAFVDPRWGLEQIISRLASFSSDQTDIL